MWTARAQTTVVKAVFILVCISLECAQVSAQDRPKLKDFGSSLERLHWDSVRNEAVETGPSNNKSRSTNDDVVRVETTLIASQVLVVNQRAQPVTGLTKKDFVVTEDDMPQTVETFAFGDDSKIPKSIVLIIDYSISQFPFIRTSIAAAETLVDKLQAVDRMAIVTDSLEVLSDFTNDKNQLKRALESLLMRATAPRVARGQPSKFGYSSQYSALMATLREAFDGEDERPIIIFQTDGDEAYYLRNSIIEPPMMSEFGEKYSPQVSEAIAKERREKMRSFSLTDVYTMVERARVMIYTIIPGFRVMDLSPERQQQQMKLEWDRRFEAWAKDSSTAARKKAREKAEERWSKLSNETVKFQIDKQAKLQAALAGVSSVSGGWTAFLEDPTEAEKIYSRIFSDITNRYIVGYYPTNKQHDGRRRKLTISVKDHPEYTVVARHWYRAPSDR